MFKHFLFSILLIFGSIAFVSCGNEEPEIPDNNAIESPDSVSNREQNNDEEEYIIKDVTVYSDGTTSDGSPYRKLDDTHFWLNYIKYEITENGTLTVVDNDFFEIENKLNGEVQLYSAITINQKKYPVTSINYWSHNRRTCEELKSIIIPNSVEKLAYACFGGCVNLKKIKLSNRLKSLPDKCFTGCESLQSIELPNSITQLGMSCFKNCIALEEVMFSNELKIISDSCFSSCRSLTSIKMPNSITQLGKSAFVDCTSLTMVQFSDNIKEIPSDCFKGKLYEVYIPNSTEFHISIYSFGFRWPNRWYFYDNLPTFEFNYDSYAVIRKYYIPSWEYISYENKCSLYNVFQPDNGGYYQRNCMIFTKLEPADFNDFFSNWLNKGHFDAFCESYNTLYINVPYDLLEKYKIYNTATSSIKWNLNGYDPETFDFDSLLDKKNE